jgi:hypothetical protein
MSDTEIEQIRVEETSKNHMDMSIINKILGNNKKKKQLPAKRAAKVLLPPCLTYISNSKQTVLKVPFTYNISKLFIKPKSTEKNPCFCGRPAKYKKPKTLSPFCSLECYRKLND